MAAARSRRSQLGVVAVGERRHQRGRHHVQPSVTGDDYRREVAGRDRRATAYRFLFVGGGAVRKGSGRA